MLGMSQVSLAEELGVTFQQVQKYEKGRNRISASRFQQICQVLRMPIAFFFDGAPDELKSSVSCQITRPHSLPRPMVWLSRGRSRK